MTARATASAVSVLLAAGCATLEETRCRGGFDATFLQLTHAELRWNEDRWEDDLEELREMGVNTVVVQYTGDTSGSFDAHGGVRALVRAAEEEEMRVWIGLWLDPAWVARWREREELPAPYLHAHELARAARLCTQSPACDGIYLPQEIDDVTLGEGAEGSARVSAFLRAATSRVRAVAPDARIAIAPYASARILPADLARFLSDATAEAPISVIMLQDGTGTGRATPAQQADRLRALRAAVEPRGVRVWSVIELFDQLHGPPIDDAPFAARPASFADVRERLRWERPAAERLIAFEARRHAATAASAGAAELHRAYRRFCRTGR